MLTSGLAYKNTSSLQHFIVSGNNNETASHVLQVLWTRLPCENFHLLMACSILESQKGELIGSNHDFNSILKVCMKAF